MDEETGGEDDKQADRPPRETYGSGGQTHRDDEGGSDSRAVHDARTTSAKVQAEVGKQRAREQRKYHSKKGAQRSGGRAKGSKAKTDNRLQLQGGFWD